MDTYSTPSTYQPVTSTSEGIQMTVTDSSTSLVDSGFAIAYIIFVLAIAVLSFVSMWKLFAKASKPGWAALVPIYNNIVQLEIAGRPVWWVLLMLVPVFNIWVSVVMMIDFVRSYQRSGWWVLGFMFLPFVALPWFAFSEKTQYRGPITAGRSDFMPAPVPVRDVV